MRSLQFSNNSAFNISGALSYIHNMKKSATTAYEINEAALIQILLPRSLGVVSVSLNIYDESCSRIIEQISCEWNGLEKEFDEYTADVHIARLGVGLYFFKIELETHFGKLFGYSDDASIRFSPYDSGLAFQLSVSDFKYSEPTSKLGGIIYHIFVDRFNRGGKVSAKPGTILDDNLQIVDLSTL